MLCFQKKVEEQKREIKQQRRVIEDLASRNKDKEKHGEMEKNKQTLKIAGSKKPKKKRTTKKKLKQTDEDDAEGLAQTDEDDAEGLAQTDEDDAEGLAQTDEDDTEPDDAETDDAETDDDDAENIKHMFDEEKVRRCLLQVVSNESGSYNCFVPDCN